MADISQEIDNFKSAVYGEEVRDSMISLAEKVNSEVEKNTEDVNGAVQTANSASEAANKAVEDAQNTLTAANKAVKEAEKSAANAEKSAKASAEAAQMAGESSEQSKAAAGTARESAERAEQIAEGLGGFDGTATSVSAIDTHNLTGAGAGKKSTVQALLDVIAQKLIEKVVTSDTFQTVLAKYLVNNGLTTEAGKFGLDAAFGKNLQDQITQQNSNKVDKNSAAQFVCIELYSTHPFIDFHNNNSSKDYTSRIIEETEGILKVYATALCDKNSRAFLSSDSTQDNGNGVRLTGIGYDGSDPYLIIDGSKHHLHLKD